MVIVKDISNTIINQCNFFTHIKIMSFQGVLYIIKYCMSYRIFETNYGVILINVIVFLKKCLPTDPSVGTNNG